MAIHKFKQTLPQNSSKSLNFVILSFRKKAKYPKIVSALLISVDFFAAACALQPVGSLVSLTQNDKINTTNLDRLPRKA